MAFTAKDVQALREKTGCGMMDCKKALVETNGDMEQAIVFLREKGLAQQAKKADRVAAEGMVYATVENGVGVVVELNAETDFVAGGDLFKALTKDVAEVILKKNPADVEALLTETNDEGKTVNDMIQEVFLAVRENIKVRRFARFEGVLTSYVHAGGKIGVLVRFDADPSVSGNPVFEEMGKDVAMQIAAVNPSYLDKSSVSDEVLAKEKEILVEQMKEDPKMANKPEQVLHKIVEGKMGKYFSENCLMQQEFVKNGDYTVEKYVEAKAKELGTAVKVAEYVRFEKGEGIQKREDNFADEVSGMIK